MNAEAFVIKMFEEFERADKDGVDVVKFIFHKDQIHEIAEAYNRVGWIEIYQKED